MLCRITDEKVHNPWEEGDDIANEMELRDPLSLTIDEIMADDFFPYVCKNKSWGFDLIIDNDNNIEMKESPIHSSAIESMADFCRRFLKSYDQTIKNK